MKSYKTWEVFEMLSENPKLVFESKEHGELRKLMVYGEYFYLKAFRDDELISPQIGAGGFNGNIKLNDGWELVQEEVPFIEAVKAYGKGKTIICKSSARQHTYKLNASDNFTDENNNPVSATELLSGKWFIKGEEK